MELNSHFNNIGFSYPDMHGNFTGFGSSYPGDQLPCPDDYIVNVSGIPFFLYNVKGCSNNIEFAGQTIKVPPAKYSALHVLGSSDNGSFSEYLRFYLEGNPVGRYKLELSNWVAGVPAYHEQEAYRCTALCAGPKIIETVKPAVWQQTIRFLQPIALDELVLPDNMCMHLFSLTLEGTDIDDRHGD
ncbi:hypothetical protein D3C73_1244460 [compost metagenome]